MKKKIQFPKKFNEATLEAKEDIRGYLCGYAICDGNIIECTKCAFYSNENFDKFIKETGL